MGKENQSFKQVIQSYLEQRAKRDSLFATSFAKQNKNIDECCNYIIGEAKKRGGNAVFMSDDEVFGLAVHYYDEDDIKVSKQTNYKRLKQKKDSIEAIMPQLNDYPSSCKDAYNELVSIYADADELFRFADEPRGSLSTYSTKTTDLYQKIEKSLKEFKIKHIQNK